MRTFKALTFLLIISLVMMPRGVIAQSVEHWLRLLELEPHNAFAYYQMGDALRSQNRQGEAIAAYRKAIELQPESENVDLVYSALGYALQQTQGGLDEAVIAFREAFELHPSWITARDLGKALREQGKPDEAIAVYRSAIELVPSSSATIYRLWMETLNEQGKLEEAIAVAHQYINFNPDDAKGYVNLGCILNEQNEFEDAIVAFYKAIELNPESYYKGWIYYNLGLALRGTGQLEESTSNFRRAVESDPQDTRFYDSLGLVLLEQGKLEESITVFRKAIDIQSNPDSINNLREAQRLLALRNAPQLTVDDRQYLPGETSEPLVQVLRSTARIISKVSGSFEIGTGWVVKREGNAVWIVTNRHVISEKDSTRPSSEISVEFFSELPDEKRPRYTAIIEQITPPDDVLDLAVLKVTGIPIDVQPLEIHPGRISRNTPIRVIGHPYTVDEPWNSVSGEIVNYNPNSTNPIVPVDAYVAVGNSGGPVINEQRQVIAMMFGIRQPQDTATKTNQDTPVNEDNIPATGEIGLAYSIDTVVAKLRDWQILN
jgi:protein O-GlcNAc transferase